MAEEEAFSVPTPEAFAGPAPPEEGPFTLPVDDCGGYRIWLWRCLYGGVLVLAFILHVHSRRVKELQALGRGRDACRAGA